MLILHRTDMTLEAETVVLDNKEHQFMNGCVTNNSLMKKHNVSNSPK